ncbi:MAG: hypothetical protein ACRC7V_04705 [Lachnospiraceae bacterium]
MNKNKTRLLLIEIIIAILFFSLASGICMQLFANASLISKDNNEKVQSLMVLQSVQGVLSKKDAVYTADFFGGIYTDDTLTITYDENWKINSSNIEYIFIAKNIEGEEWSIVISNDKTKKEIVNQNLIIHKPITLQEVYDYE